MKATDRRQQATERRSTRHRYESFDGTDSQTMADHLCAVVLMLRLRFSST